MRISLSQAIEGYELAAYARRLSKRTLADYGNTFSKLLDYLGENPPIAAIATADLRGFLAAQDSVGAKTLLNYHTGLSALWKWATGEGLVEKNIVRQIEPPKPEKRVIEPYTDEDVRATPRATEQSQRYRRPGQRETSNRLATAGRNKAMLLMLLDTGVRAEELCKARLANLDLRNLKLKVMGKGARERILRISAGTGQAIWRYLTIRPKEDQRPGRPLFVSSFGREIARGDLSHIVKRIGDRAGVRRASCHRFRHTFAIQFLRNQGNPWALQKALGHSTMDMVKHYLALAQADLEAAHQQARPVANWGL